MKRFIKYVDKDSQVYLICESDHDVKYKIKPDRFQDKQLVYEKEFYIQDMKEEGQLITYAFPW